MSTARTLAVSLTGKTLAASRFSPALAHRTVHRAPIVLRAGPNVSSWDEKLIRFQARWGARFESNVLTHGFCLLPDFAG